VRQRLKVSDRSYWRRIDAGLQVGCRKGKFAGRWVMPMYQRQRVCLVETIALANDVLDARGAVGAISSWILLLKIDLPRAQRCIAKHIILLRESSHINLELRVISCQEFFNDLSPML
jgi:hypothetical protein